MKKLLVVLTVGVLAQFGSAFADDHHGDAKMVAGCEGDGLMVHVYKMNQVDRTYAMIKPQTGEPMVIQINRTYNQDKLHYFLAQDFTLRIVTNSLDFIDGADVLAEEHPFDGMMKYKNYKNGDKVSLKCMFNQ